MSGPTRDFHRDRQCELGGMTEEEVARVVGITPGGVYMAERAAIRKIWRKQLGRAKPRDRLEA